MFNIYRMERFRALKTKIIINMLIIAGIFSVMNVFLGTLGEQKGKTINVCSQFTQILSNKVLLPILAIVIAVYISGEYKNGFLKSIAGQITNRSYLVLSKVLFATVYTIELFAGCFLFTLISAIIFGKNNIILGFSPEMMGIWGIQLLLHVGFSCIFILITIVTRSSSLGIGLGIFTLAGLSELIYAGINYLVAKTGISSHFNIGKYMIEKNVEFVQSGVSAQIFVNAIIVGLVFAILFTVLSINVMKKRDI